MKNQKRAVFPGEGHGPMRTNLDLFEALDAMNIDEIKMCLSEDPDSINSLTNNDDNAMHVLIANGASIRASHLIEFFLNETEIDLLHKNEDGLDPLDMAFSLNDFRAAELLEPYSNDQLNKRFGKGEIQSIRIVKSDNKPIDPGSGPS